MQQRGFSKQQIESMTCPVGLPEVTGKLPMEVAISIAGELIGLYQGLQSQQSTPKGKGWKELQGNLVQLSALQSTESKVG